MTLAKKVLKDLENYSFWIKDISRSYRVSDKQEFNVYLSGLIEEIAEYEYEKNTNGVESELKIEIGDALAYWVLCVNYLDLPIRSYDFEENPHPVNSWKLVKDLSGQLKRINRGDGDIHVLQKLLSLALSYIGFEIFDLRCSFSEIIEINIDKLEKRLNLNRR